LIGRKPVNLIVGWCGRFLFFVVPRQFSQVVSEWPENQILIPDWTYFHCPGATLVKLVEPNKVRFDINFGVPDKVDSLARAELQSSRRLMIHAHMLIEINHYTKVHLDVDKLRAYMESAMGHHIHVDNKIPGSSKEDLNRIKAYIQKEETS